MRSSLASKNLIVMFSLATNSFVNVNATFYMIGSLFGARPMIIFGSLLGLVVEKQGFKNDHGFKTQVLFINSIIVGGTPEDVSYAKIP